MRTYQEVDGNSWLDFLRCFHPSSKKELAMHSQAGKHELCNCGDSAHKLNALVFACEPGIAQYEEE